MRDFMAMLRTQRFDDYRYYHQSRINQTLHLISAIIFLGCYALLFSDAALAGLVGWLAMLTRQIGHFLSPTVTTPSTTPPTNTRKTSRSATTSAARSCC